MTVTLNEILKRLANATQKIENGDVKGEPLDDEEMEENGSDTSSHIADTNGNGNAGSDGEKANGLAKAKSRRRYKGKKKTVIAGRTWVKLEDPHAPRRPRSAYVLFLSTNRSKYGSAKEGVHNQSGINVALASEWQKLNENERQVYIDRANEERAQYEREMSTYKDTPEYYEFALKKSVIMKQRKMYRQAGIPTEQLQTSEEAILKMDKVELERLQSALKGGSVSKNAKNQQTPVFDLSSMVPKVGDVAIFSDAFLNYNKSREADLRAVRRAIGIAEDERQGLMGAITRLTSNHSEVAEQNTIVENQLQAWLSVAATALSLAALPQATDLPRNSTQQNVFETITQAAASPASDALAMALREALKGAQFSTAT
ncbi:unnamed protein product, partial [Mesorhabditis belari]|uniref:HMG box domain-containing protein n=1 Tax=Mesorhabditis belari TaxID=2138241 RepID=A0AAF3J5D0_9BILA